MQGLIYLGSSSLALLRHVGRFGEFLVPVLDQLNLRWWGSRGARVMISLPPLLFRGLQQQSTDQELPQLFGNPRKITELIRLNRRRRRRTVTKKSNQPRKSHYFQPVNGQVSSSAQTVSLTSRFPPFHSSGQGHLAIVFLLSTVYQLPVATIRKRKGTEKKEKEVRPCLAWPHPLSSHSCLPADPSAGVRVAPSVPSAIRDKKTVHRPSQLHTTITPTSAP